MCKTLKPHLNRSFENTYGIKITSSACRQGPHIYADSWALVLTYSSKGPSEVPNFFFLQTLPLPMHLSGLIESPTPTETKNLATWDGQWWSIQSHVVKAPRLQEVSIELPATEGTKCRENLNHALAHFHFSHSLPTGLTHRQILWSACDDFDSLGKNAVFAYHID
jgi:hypothetical protein